LLLQASANSNYGEEFSPLCSAIRRAKKYTNSVKTLIDSNADIDSCSLSGFIALMIAAIQKNMEIVEILLEKSADLDATDKYGYIALDKAAY